MSFQPFVSMAPGRVCLFGEHQDYLDLPVIAAAIPLHCRMVVTPREDGIWSVQTPALHFSWQCHVDDAGQAQTNAPSGPASFLRAGLFEALSEGWDVHSGGDVQCHVDLPVQSGLSSSSAMVVAWVQSLARVAEVELSPMELARWSHQVEVVHFKAPGGHMDHVASALGGVLRIHPNWQVERLDAPEAGVWVVFDSGQPKDTQVHLDRCKTRRVKLAEDFFGAWNPPNEVEGWATMSRESQSLWQSTIGSAQIEARASARWNEEATVAEWMTLHQAYLRDGLELSTPKLEALGQAAMKGGAWGWKLVGSGGGGCGVAWVPKPLAARVHLELRRAGATATWSVSPTAGARCEPWSPPKCPAVVLAAGRSSRMKAFDDLAKVALTTSEMVLIQNRPKAMLPVGPEGQPFLSLLLHQMAAEGVDDVCVVLSAEDAGSMALLAPWIPSNMRLGYAFQTIAQGRSKPAGTADAVEAALRTRPEWSGCSVVVCNGDNLPPAGALTELQTTEQGMVGFSRKDLGLPGERVKSFAVVVENERGSVQTLIEKPSSEEVALAQDDDGDVWVSMNLFRLPHEALLAACSEVEEHTGRAERELPAAAMLLAQRKATNLQLLKFRGKFLDLTHPSDWLQLKNSSR